jgi:hypothetical protein
MTQTLNSMQAEQELGSPLPPACFTDIQWREWKVLAAKVDTYPDAGFCEDCTAAYQQKMIAEGRCQYPDVQFHPDEDGFPVGVRYAIIPIVPVSNNHTGA